MTIARNVSAWLRPERPQGKRRLLPICPIFGHGILEYWYADHRRSTPNRLPVNLITRRHTSFTSPAHPWTSMRIYPGADLIMEWLLVRHLVKQNNNHRTSYGHNVENRDLGFTVCRDRTFTNPTLGVNFVKRVHRQAKILFRPSHRVHTMCSMNTSNTSLAQAIVPWIS